MSRVENRSDRESFVQKRLEIMTIVRVMLPFGVSSFGTQHDQIESFREKFVRETKWLTQSQFRQIINLCQSLPGSTAVQILIIISTMLTKSPIAGIISFLIYCIPGSFALFLLGTFMQIYVQDQYNLPVQIRLICLGLKSSGAAIMAIALFNNFRVHMGSLFKVLIVLITAISYFFQRTPNCIQFCLVLGAIFSLYVQIQSKRKMNDSTKKIMETMKKYSILFGKLSVYLLLIFYLILWLTFKFSPENRYSYCEIFYFVACLIFGPASAIFPLLYAYFVSSNVMTIPQFWMGVPFAFLLPGTAINIAVYYGTLIDGFRGAVLSWICIYAPTFLSVYGILPEWSQYRDRIGISRLLIGASCVTSGFLLAGILMLIQHCVQRDPGITFGIFFLTLFLHGMIHLAPPLLLLMSATLANTRRWGLIYYRELPQPNY